MNKFNNQADNCIKDNLDESQNDIQNKFYIKDDKIGNSFKELPSFNDNSKEENNEINEDSFMNIIQDLNVSDISSYEDEPQKENNKEIEIILNNLRETLEDQIKSDVKNFEEIKEKEISINLNESKEVNGTKKGLEVEYNDKEVSKTKNISKSDKNELKEASKIFVIQKEPEKKLIGRKRKSEHNKGDLDEQNKDKFC